MYARSTTINAQSGSIDAGIAHIRDEVLPALRELDGFVGLSLMVDRDSGRCIATTAWANEDAMREFPVSTDTGDQIDRFLRSPEPELLVFDCAPEANVFPMVPAGAALSEMLLEEEPSQ